MGKFLFPFLFFCFPYVPNRELIIWRGLCFDFRSILFDLIVVVVNEMDPGPCLQFSSYLIIERCVIDLCELCRMFWYYFLLVMNLLSIWILWKLGIFVFHHLTQLYVSLMIFLCFELREKYLDVIFLLGSAWLFLKKITPQKIWLLDLRALIISMDMNKVLKLRGPS